MVVVAGDRVGAEVAAAATEAKEVAPTVERRFDGAQLERRFDGAQAEAWEGVVATPKTMPMPQRAGAYPDDDYSLASSVGRRTQRPMRPARWRQPRRTPLLVPPPLHQRRALQA